MTQLPVLLLDARAAVPARAHDGDAGLDLVAIEALELGPGERGSVGTGLAIELPEGHAGLVVPRSGLARRHGVTLTNSPGLIDAGYRGEVQVLMVNHGGDPHTITPGERVAQLVLVPVWTGDPVEVDELPASDGRGEGGFGSSGR